MSTDAVVDFLCTNSQRSNAYSRSKQFIADSLAHPRLNGFFPTRKSGNHQST